jgi:hypothetical protein
MTDDQPGAEPERSGALFWRNWQGYQAGAGPAYEATLYSDAALNGAYVVAGMGPYTLFNTIATRHGELKETLVIRWSSHLPEGTYLPSNYKKSATDSWLGLELDQEFAAVLALVLGVRLWAGGVTREFRDENDPAGQPVAFAHVAPTWQRPRYAVLPRLLDATVFIGDLPTRLARLSALNAAESVALIRAARLYQMAVWVADEDPELAWLQLVSAAEVAADHWYGNKQEPTEALADSQSELVELLRERGGEELVAEVATKLSGVVGSTRKFLEFLTAFAPDPPDTRCEDAFQVPWTSLRKRLRLVYKYRSKRLHSGIPFPGVLNQPPQSGGGEPVRFMEKPPGVAAITATSHWPASELPMFLWLFEHIVRGALLRWFHESLGSNE